MKPYIILLIIGFCLRESGSSFLFSTISDECSKRYYSSTSFVCVCNSSYCNFDGSLLPFEENQVRVVKSSQDEFLDIIINVNTTIRKQSIHGFGGAVTDAAAIDIKSLSQEAQNNLIKMYFGPQGSRYNIIRVNIAGCDFSVRGYSYDDIPIIKQAINLSSEEIYIFGSPWAPPAWMKTNNDIGGDGQLRKDMWQPYADYLVKFFQMYEDNLGVQLWGFTPLNEPLVAMNRSDFPGNTCVWFPEDMRDWISTVLGPTLEEEGYSRLILMIYDFNRLYLESYVEPILSDPSANHYVDGTAVHWYDDDILGPEGLDNVHNMDPSKFILYTEACTGTDGEDVALGSWDRGEQYINDIIEDINHWSTGWVDWNIVLDQYGGPNWEDNYVDAPIIVNTTADEFYVQPLYYALNLFSRNVARGSVYIHSDVNNDNIKTTAFVNPDEEVVLIVANLISM
ncbi:putative glucosylceramidase 3 [Armadillidium nasatum]|uniref:Glucosylceramidase n=1 Tax=Armadillidium nasatum TaxID=96803 RepID=A0A5N5TM40_9CRUS|nr:putative glucosylceramidase 3 [Armadillidium nasatum]